MSRLGQGAPIKKQGRGGVGLASVLRVPITLFPYPLRFTDRELILWPLEELAAELRVSRAFLRTCVAAGCPQKSGGISVAGCLTWLFEHYPEVRALAGLATLPPIPPKNLHPTLRLRMAYAVLTLLEYGRSRASQWRQKRALRLAVEQVERLAASVA